MAKFAIGTRIEVLLTVSAVALKTIVVKLEFEATSQSLLAWSVPAPLLEEKAEEDRVIPGVQFSPGLRPVDPLTGEVMVGVATVGTAVAVVTLQASLVVPMLMVSV